MISTIENEYLSVSAESAGAQLKSIKSVKTGKEYLWQGDERYWTGRAYNLFPIIGRMTDNKYTYGGNTYEMLIHGFVRRNELTLVDVKKESMTFEISSNDITRSQYPFEFVYKVIYSLDKNKLNITYSVTNKDDKEIIFGVGGHPGFNVPFDGGEFDDYGVVFPDAHNVLRVIMSDTCFITGEKREYPLDGKTLALRHDLFDRDAVILENTGGLAVIKGKGGSEIRFSYPDMKYVGVWHKPMTDAPFVCLEPWSALPAFDSKTDALETKPDMTHLPCNGTYTNTYSVEIVEK